LVNSSTLASDYTKKKVGCNVASCWW